jgi:hypothetical protein
MNNPPTAIAVKRAAVTTRFVAMPKPASIPTPRTTTLLAARRDDSGEDFIETRIYLGPAIEQGAFAPRLFRACQRRDCGWQRNETEHHDRQPPIKLRHDKHGQGEVQHRREDVEQDLGDGIDEALDSAIKAGHDGANTFLAVEA